MKDTHRDTVDCLLSELSDAYWAVRKLRVNRDDWEENVEAAESSIERAFQLVSDLKAAQS